MKLINPDVTILPQSKGLEGVYKQIEIAGRTCYKSEDKITEDSCKEFVQRMINSGHTAMLEHGTVYLHRSGYWSTFYTDNPYSKVTKDCDGDHCITTNLRVLVENNLLDDLDYLCEPTEFHEKRTTVRFVCSRSISHEAVRHRVFSFAQESTRFCNYSKDKFNRTLTFIIPTWATNLKEGIISYSPNEITKCEAEFIRSCQIDEDMYFNLISNGAKAQEAREVLPNALKTELVMTGFNSDWKHFFRLRTTLLAETGKPHPDMSYLADILYTEFVKRKFIEPLV